MSAPSSPVSSSAATDATAAPATATVGAPLVYNFDQSVSFDHWYIGCPFGIGYNKFGRCLIASRDIEMNETVLIDRPYTWAVEEKFLKTVCRYCFEETETEWSTKCPECEQVYYCSERCVMLDSAQHRNFECKIFSTWNLDESYREQEETISEMRLLVRTMSRRLLETHPVDPELLGWANDVRFQDYRQIICEHSQFPPSLIESLKYWVVDFITAITDPMHAEDETDKDDPDEIMEILIRNRRNAFCLWKPNDDAVAQQTKGHGVFVKSSMFNHCCMPNVAFRRATDKLQFEFFAREAIPAGTELTISYLDHDELHSRREQLKEGWLFDCNCWYCQVQEKEERDRDASNSAEAALNDLTLNN